MTLGLQRSLAELWEGDADDGKLCLFTAPATAPSHSEDGRVSLTDGRGEGARPVTTKDCKTIYKS